MMNELVEGCLKENQFKSFFKYIDKNKSQSYVVIFEDLNRLSRDIQVHALLKAEFKKRGVELASPNFQFESSPEGDFKENISVIVAQYEKDKNKERVNNRMRARLEQGYWCFRVPIGYKYTEAENGGKIIVKDEKIAKHLKKGFEDYANGYLKTQSELINFLDKKGIKVAEKNNKGHFVSISTINNLLRNILYTGYLELPKWDIKLTKAKHEGIITMKTYKKIQERLQGTSKKERIIDRNIARKDISEDFPLRGMLFCENSRNMLSAGWSKGRNMMVPYYKYPKNSPMHGKSINRDKLHNEFEEILEKITPNKEFLSLFEKIFTDILNERNSNSEKIIKEAEKEIKKIDSQVDNFIDRIGNSNNEKLILNYENKIAELEKIKGEKIQIIEKNGKTLKNVSTRLKSNLHTISNSLKIWKSGDLKIKKELVKMIFPDGILINKKEVFQPLVYRLFIRPLKTQKRLISIWWAQGDFSTNFLATYKYIFENVKYIKNYINVFRLIKTGNM